MTVHVLSEFSRPSPRVTRSIIPDDAHAIIYRPARSAMTSGKARTRDWKLRFERRTAPYIEPLMGWCADDDTLAQVELSFPSLEAAVAYARRHGLTCTVHGAPHGRAALHAMAGAAQAERAAEATRRGPQASVGRAAA